MVVLGKVRKSGGMGIIRCEKGLHFYDNVKYDKCPYCEQRKQQIQKNTNIMQEQKTVAVQAEKLSELEEYICRQEKEKIEANDYGRDNRVLLAGTGKRLCDRVAGMRERSGKRTRLSTTPRIQQAWAKYGYGCYFFGRQKHFTGYALLGCI